MKNQALCKSREKKRYSEDRNTKRLSYNLKTLYGITVDEFTKLRVTQNNSCAICKKQQKRRLSVDHNHKTGQIRGLLCGSCNFGIGIFKEDLNLLNKAITYLKESYEKTN